MFDEQLKSTKLWSTRRNPALDEFELNNSSNDSEEDEMDDSFAGPSTSSNFRSNGRVDSRAAEDDETKQTNDPLKFRELLAEIRRMLDQDSVFNRIRSELLDQLERLIRNHVNANSDKTATYRQRFEFYERLDDLVSSFTDLDESHLAVLHYTAQQLAKHTSLEVIEVDQEPEHLIVPPTQNQGSFAEAVEVPSARKPRKAKVVDEWNSSTVAMSKTEHERIENELNGETSTRNANGQTADHEYEQNGGSEVAKSNGVQTDHEKTRLDIGDEDEVLVNGEKRTFSRSNSDYPLEDVPMDDKKLMSPLVEAVDDEPSSDSDTNARSPGKNRREVKKPQRRLTYPKPNGVSKHTKEKSTNRKPSGRLNKLQSEGELKKKRRAAAVIATTSVSELVGRPASQRRNTRNANQAAPDPEASTEPTYCLCDQISYGNMICCDNSECAIEWFHFDCVKLKVKPPKGKKWFCPSCKESTGRKNTR